MLTRAMASAILSGFTFISCMMSLGGCSGDDTTPALPSTRTETAATTIAPRALPDRAPLGYARGSDDATVMVTEFSDFGCHYCAQFARTVLPEVDREFIASGRVRWRLVPLATVSTPHALEAAAAVECAAQQGRVWAMHDRLFSSQHEWSRFGNPARRFTSYARDLGLDDGRFATCLRDPRTTEIVGALRQLARQLDVRVAPTFFVSGRRVEGALPLEEVRSVLEVALASR